MDLTEAIVESMLGDQQSGIRAAILGNAIARDNTPASFAFLGPGEARSDRNTLYLVDRILEPQTIAHFVSCIGDIGILPSGDKVTLPLLGDDVFLMMQPYKEWAPAPFNDRDRCVQEEMMVHIGSYEDSSRLQVVPKDLHAMKSRLWENVMPHSSRRWCEKGLDNLENFSSACQQITLVTNVFHYLNDPTAQVALRDTYNLIYDRLEYFGKALNALRAQEFREPVSVTALWAEYMCDHYATMEASAHAYIMEHLATLKKAVLDALAAHRPEGGPADNLDTRQWELTNMWQDLTENVSHADWGIFMPMEGYKGCSSPSAVPGRRLAPALPPVDGTQPVGFSPDKARRAREYHLRRRHINLTLTQEEVMRNAASGPPRPKPRNDPEDLVSLCAQQAKAQDQAREELRGIALPPDMRKLWPLHANDVDGMGYVMYQTSAAHTAGDWEEFRQRFGADIADWGRDLTGVDELRTQCKVSFVDAQQLGLEKTEVENLKEHFATFRESSDFPAHTNKETFLVADAASVSSYLRPVPRADAVGLPAGDLGPFVLAVDTYFDPDEPAGEHADESPGYAGAIRVLGSLLWDDVGALTATQTQGLQELWPLAMEHPLQVYVGPVVGAQRQAWEALNADMRRVLEEWFNETSNN